MCRDTQQGLRATEEACRGSQADRQSCEPNSAAHDIHRRGDLYSSALEVAGNAQEIQLICGCT